MGKLLKSVLPSTLVRSSALGIRSLRNPDLLISEDTILGGKGQEKRVQKEFKA